MVSERKDLFDRPGFVWEVVEDTDLPGWLRANRRKFGHLFYGDQKRTGVLSWLMGVFSRS